MRRVGAVSAAEKAAVPPLSCFVVFVTGCPEPLDSRILTEELSPSAPKRIGCEGERRRVSRLAQLVSRLVLAFAKRRFAVAVGFRRRSTSGRSTFLSQPPSRPERVVVALRCALRGGSRRRCGRLERSVSPGFGWGSSF